MAILLYSKSDAHLPCSAYWLLTVLIRIATMIVHSTGLDTTVASPGRGSLTTLTTTQTLLDALCPKITCVNGNCYLAGNQPKCSCNDLYLGPQCDIIDLNKATCIVIGSMVIFKWPLPPLMKGYSFIYYQVDDPIMNIYAREIIMGDDETSALVGSLRDGVALYKICIDKNSIANHAVLTQSLPNIDNCVTVSTHPDYHSVFAWFLAACSCVVAVLLIYWQRDKIALLYFSRTIVVNNGGYNYNVEELIRQEKQRKLSMSDSQYQPLQGTDDDLAPAGKDKNLFNKITLETIEDEN